MTKKQTEVASDEIGRYTEPTKAPKGVIETAKDLLNNYILNEKVRDFSQVSVYAKLELLQRTPAKFIEKREVGGKTVHYVPHQYSKTCLNFVFNFKVSNEIVKEEYFAYKEEYMEKQKDGSYKKAVRDVVEAEATVKFYFTWQDGQETFRTVKSSHKQYANKATSRGDAMQAAISKSWTKVAATFGIGADLEDDLYAKKPDVIIEQEEEAPYEAPRKSFDPGF